MSIKLHDTISISGHFLPALINDDPSGLSVEDSKALIQWTISNPLLAAGILDVKGEPSFERDTSLVCYQTAMKLMSTLMTVGREHKT
jgi:hypothetical protein